MINLSPKKEGDISGEMSPELKQVNLPVLSYLDLVVSGLPVEKTGYQGRLYPNGEFTLGYVPPRKKRRDDSKYESLISASLPWRSRVLWESENGRITKGLGYKEHFDWERYNSLVSLDKVDLLEPPVGSSDVSISHRQAEQGSEPLPTSRPARRGSRGLTVRGRRQIRSGCYLMGQQYKGRLGFLTLTLPSFPYREDVLAFLILEWPEILRHFLIKFKRLAVSLGFPPLYVGCVELQGDRLEKFSHPCPHAHLVYVCRKKSRGSGFYVSANEFRALWRETIENRLKALSSDSPIDFESDAAIDCVVLKKDPGRYISKYLSKGKNPVEMAKDKGLAAFLPSGWVICCAVIKKAIVSLTTDIPLDWKKAILNGIPLVSRGILIYLYKIEGEGFLPGYSGQFARGTPVALNPL